LCEALVRGGSTVDHWNNGVNACTACVEDPESQKSQCREWRGDLHHKLGNWGEAIGDFTAALNNQRNNMRLRQKLQQTQKAKKMAERKDYYKIMGVSRDATRSDIKRAFRDKALTEHPDLFQDEKQKEIQTEKFAHISEAYTVLLDPEKRGRFDRGEDVDEDPRQHRHGGFHPFRGGGGGNFHFKFN